MQPASQVTETYHRLLPRRYEQTPAYKPVTSSSATRNVYLCSIARGAQKIFRFSVPKKSYRKADQLLGATSIVDAYSTYSHALVLCDTDLRCYLLMRLLNLGFAVYSVTCHRRNQRSDLETRVKITPYRCPCEWIKCIPLHRRRVTG